MNSFINKNFSYRNVIDIPNKGGLYNIIMDTYWEYIDKDGNIPVFSDDVEVQILKDAIDAMDNLGYLPCWIEKD